MSAPTGRVYWTPAVLTQPWTRPASTWRAASTLPAGTAVTVEWAHHRKRAVVHLRMRWGYQSLFSMPLEAAKDYVRREGKE